MGTAEIKKQVRKKQFLIDAFLYTSSLRSGRGPELALKHAVTSHFLLAVILELTIKILYELDRRASAPFTHNLTRLFDELDEQTKTTLEERFDEARERGRKEFAAVEDVEFHGLRDVLANNEATVKNFKYDAMGVPANSAADMTFYREVFEYIDKKVEQLGD